MNRLAYVLIVLLIAIVAAQTILLLGQRREAARLRESERQRVAFCLSYRGMVQSTRYALEKKDAARDSFFGDLFYYWTQAPFLDICRVREPARTKVANRNWGCGSEIGEKKDYACLAGVARELEAAIPLE